MPYLRLFLMKKKDCIHFLKQDNVIMSGHVKHGFLLLIKCFLLIDGEGYTLRTGLLIYAQIERKQTNEQKQKPHHSQSPNRNTTHL